MTRLHCCVPHCRRAIAPSVAALEWPDDVWICGDHYRAVPKKYKALKRRLRVKLRRSPDDVSALGRYLRVSRRVVVEAMERAAGI